MRVHFYVSDKKIFRTIAYYVNPTVFPDVSVDSMSEFPPYFNFLRFSRISIFGEQNCFSIMDHSSFYGYDSSCFLQFPSFVLFGISFVFPLEVGRYVGLLFSRGLPSGPFRCGRGFPPSDSDCLNNIFYVIALFTEKSF